MAKYFLLFEKGESVRWLGHLDILRTLERAIRRAALPIAFSAGFNPREKLAFSPALSVGITGANEIMIVELTEEVAPDAILDKLNAALPPGIRFHTCDILEANDLREKLSLCDRGEYKVSCLIAKETPFADIENAITRFMAQETIIVVREKEGRKKEVNLRPNIYALATTLEDYSPDGRCAVTMIVGQGESGTAKPAEVIAALAQELPELCLRRAQRVRLIQKTVL